MSGTFVLLLSCLIALASAAPQYRVVGNAIPAECLQPPVVDPAARCGNNLSIQYFYDSRTGDCEKFLYAGCGGSRNIFPSERACEAVCERDDHSFERFGGFDFDK